MVLAQHHFHELSSKRSGAPRDHHARIGPVNWVHVFLASIPCQYLHPRKISAYPGKHIRAARRSISGEGIKRLCQTDDCKVVMRLDTQMTNVWSPPASRINWLGRPGDQHWSSGLSVFHRILGGLAAVIATFAIYSSSCAAWADGVAKKGNVIQAIC